MNIQNNKEKELTFRALFWGVIVGLILLALSIYLYAVVGMDINPAPVASMLGIFLLPVIGGKVSKKEVNIMQTTASAVVCGSLAIPMIYIAAMYLGEEFNYIGIVIPLFLADVIGICFVVFFRKQYIEDPALSFPQSIIAKTAVDKVGQLTGRESRLLFVFVIIGFLLTFLQNKGVLPQIVDFTPKLPAGMTLGILIMPLMLGMGYMIGSKVCMIFMLTTLVGNLLYAPLGFRAGWFADPAVDYSGMQNFNIPMVIGITLMGSLIPIFKQRKAFLASFRFDRKAMSKESDQALLRIMAFVFAGASAALVIFCSLYYHVNVILMCLFLLMGILFSIIAVRVQAESGLSATMPLSMLMLMVIYLATKQITVAMILTFLMISVLFLAQNTMGDLKTGAIFGSSPRKQVWAQFAGVIPSVILGALFCYLLIRAYGLDSAFFSYPLGKMYYAIGAGISEGGMSSVFHLGRLGIGAVIGAALTFMGLPAGVVGLGLYLAPSSIMALGLGGAVRFVIERVKGSETAERYNNAATGMIIGDTLVTIITVFTTMSQL